MQLVLEEHAPPASPLVAAPVGAAAPAALLDRTTSDKLVEQARRLVAESQAEVAAAAAEAVEEELAAVERELANLKANGVGVGS